MYKIGPLYNKPFTYAVYKNFFTPNQINYIYKNLEKIPYHQATVVNEGKNNYRESRIKWIPFEETWEVLYQSVLGLVHTSNSYNWKFDLKELTNQFQYTEYHGSDKGKYDWHVDLGDDDYSFRKLSITIQLSDPNEYEGGDLQIFDSPDDLIGEKETATNFPYKTMERGLGTAVIFPSFAVHRVSPVTKGVRKSLVLWVGGKPFK